MFVVVDVDSPGPCIIKFVQGPILSGFGGKELMRVAAFSDGHGYLPEISECDIVCIAGDISPLRQQTNLKEMFSWLEFKFIPWANNAPCDKIFLVAGNHDFVFESLPYNNRIRYLFENYCNKIVYLQDETYLYKGKHLIYGSPWVTGPAGWAFYSENLNPLAKNYPYGKKVDVAIFHQPLCAGDNGSVLQNTHSKMSFGSYKLDNLVVDEQPKLVVTGHVHSGNHCEVIVGENSRVVNVSLKDEEYWVKYPVYYTNV